MTDAEQRPALGASEDLGQRERSAEQRIDDFLARAATYRAQSRGAGWPDALRTEGALLLAEWAELATLRSAEIKTALGRLETAGQGGAFDALPEGAVEQIKATLQRAAAAHAATAEERRGLLACVVGGGNA